MPKTAVHDGPDLFDLLAEQEHGPLACTHVTAVGKNGSGWELELDPDSAYYLEWVDSNPRCRRSAFPGTKEVLDAEEG